MLDRLQDPGNLGTLIRTADAVGAAAIILIEPCVDPFDPKTLRGSMGSLFNVPVDQHERRGRSVCVGCKAAACAPSAPIRTRASSGAKVCGGAGWRSSSATRRGDCRRMWPRRSSRMPGCPS